jgi:hypothetical protein
MIQRAEHQKTHHQNIKELIQIRKAGEEVEVEGVEEVGDTVQDDPEGNMKQMMRLRHPMCPLHLPKFQINV